MNREGEVSGNGSMMRSPSLRVERGEPEAGVSRERRAGLPRAQSRGGGDE